MPNEGPTIKLIAELPLPGSVKSLLLELGYSKLYPPQEAAIEAGVLEGENLVISAPTASGKTLVAELTMLKKNLEEGLKSVYLTPLRALASEKYEEFSKYSKLGIKVALSTGDYDSSDPWLGEYDIIVATYEKMDSLLRHRAPWLERVALVVLDEIHLLHDGKRGPTLEMVVARFKRLEREPQFLGLSATIRNCREIAEWLNARLVESSWRPVPLKEGVYFDGDIFYDDGSVKYIGKKFDPVTDLMLSSLEEGGQVLVFTSTRHSAVSTARKLAKRVKRFLNSNLRSMLSKVSHDILSHERNRISEALAECVRYGVAFHHAGLSRTVRRTIESSFRSNLIQVVVATPTLAAGVNLPARRVIISHYRRFNAELGYHEPIPVLEYKQMAGRAGRPKYDEYGESVLIARSMRELDLLFEEYIKAEPERIVSKLASEKSLRSHILAAISSGYAYNLRELNELIDFTFYGYQFKGYSIEQKVENVVDFLKSVNMIYEEAEEEYTFKATPIGKRVAQLYIDPMSAVVMISTMKGKKRLSELAGLHLVVKTPDMPKLYIRRREEELYEKYMEEFKDELLIDDELNSNQYDYEYLLSELKTVKLLHDWINEVPEEKLIEIYDVGPGDIYSLTQTAEWLLYSAAELAKIEGMFEHYRSLAILRERVKHGVKEELLDLVRVKGIGRVRARMLFRHGFRTIEDLRKATLEQLVSVPGVGVEVAKRIKEYLGEEVRDEEFEMLRRARKVTLEDFL